VIGGEDTLRGAQKIAKEANRQGMALGVIRIPKTIDNDVSFVQKTFGFETAVPEARRPIYAANTEAEAAPNDIGLVKLMGRDSGFIAAYSVLVDSQANFCLVPEVEFTLEKFLPELTDIGTFLRDAINNYFNQTGTKVSIKYIDPSYNTSLKYHLYYVKN